MDWEERKVLVAGGDGFLGYEVCKMLAGRGADVIALDKQRSRFNGNEDFKFVRCDVNNFNNLSNEVEDLGLDFVFNFTFSMNEDNSSSELEQMVETNMVGLNNLLRVSRGAEKFVHASKGHVYGNSSNPPTSEEQTPRPEGPYHVTRYVQEKLCRTFGNDLDIVIGREYNHYGPGQHRGYAVPEFILRTLSKDAIKIAETSRDFTHVKDSARGFVKLAEEGRKDEAYNISSGKEVYLPELVDKIFEIVGHETDMKKAPGLREHEIKRMCGSNEKAKQELDWRPKISLEEGLKETIDFYKKNLESYVE